MRDLGRLGQFLKVDRCIFYLAAADMSQFAIVDHYNWWADADRESVLILGETGRLPGRSMPAAPSLAGI